MGIVLSFSDMVQVGTFQVSQKARSQNGYTTRAIKIYQDNPIIATFEAVAKGYAISKVDGPLPFADIVGMAYAVYDAGSAWYDYFTK